MATQDFQNLLDRLLNQSINDFGFSHWGAQKLERPLSFDHYKTWLENKHHGEMKYLEEHSSKKENPASISPKIKSAFIFAYPYVDGIPGLESFPLKKNRVALYAHGIDYHFWLKEKLTAVIDRLKQTFPDEEFLPVSDSFPLMERDLAARAGMGWFGKNTCLIHPQKGSLFLLGEILTSLDLQKSSDPLPDFCGTCRKCLDICPTQAIESPRKLNATKCISYWTIESRQVAPENLRSQFNDWLFGCDLCQSVCPWNQKIYKQKLETQEFLFHPPEAQKDLEEELLFILTASGKKIAKWVHGTPLARAGSFGLRRNALVVIGNKKIKPLKSIVEKYLQDEKLSELAQWTLQKLADESLS